MYPLSVSTYPMQGHRGLDQFAADVGLVAGYAQNRSLVHNKTG